MKRREEGLLPRHRRGPFLSFPSLFVAPPLARVGSLSLRCPSSLVEKNIHTATKNLWYTCMTFVKNSHLCSSSLSVWLYPFLSPSPPPPQFLPLVHSVAALLPRLKQQDSYLPQIKIDKMLRLMGDITPKVPPHDAMPRRVVLLIELFFNERGNVLFNVKLVEGLGGTVDGVLLHVFGHVCVFDDGFALGHGLYGVCVCVCACTRGSEARVGVVGGVCGCVGIAAGVRWLGLRGWWWWKEGAWSLCVGVGVCECECVDASGCMWYMW